MSLLELIKERPEDLLIPNAGVNKDVLTNLKESLDPVAGEFSPLDAIHVDGLRAEQVWVQVQMVLDSVSPSLAEAIGSSAPVEHNDEEVDSEEESEDGNEEIDSEIEVDEDEEIEVDEDEDEDEDLGEDEDEDVQIGEETEDVFEDAEEDFNEPAGENVDDSGAEKEDNFDIAEFQQHVMQLEQLNDDEIDSEDEIDYSKPVEGSDSDENVYFNDFFAPPKQKKRVRFDSNNEGADLDNLEAVDEDLEDVFDNVRKDLFSEDEEEGVFAGSEDEDGNKVLSEFEKQQQEIAKQITDLENENVGEKDWGMRGEIRARERPEESLVSADLQFERGVKPAPIITEEVTQSLEDLIKERIMKKRFDDLERRTTQDLPTARKELPELSETKSQKSLGELYEEDHMRAENPDYYVQKEGEAVTKAHTEVIDLFNDVNHKLDVLCSFQYTPRAPVASVSIIADQPTTAVEDAQPGTMADASQLAPHEIYKGEAVPMANAEMSTSLKRKKRREKATALKKKQKVQDTNAKPARSSKDEMFSTLKRGNVTVIDKRGTKRDLKGNKRTEEVNQSASYIKL